MRSTFTRKNNHYAKKNRKIFEKMQFQHSPNWNKKALATYRLQIVKRSSSLLFY